MEILDSFMVDNVEERFIVRLVQVDVVFPLKHLYIVEYKKGNPLGYLYFTKLFAMIKYNQIKNGYKSCWLEYSVYDLGGNTNERRC